MPITLINFVLLFVSIYMFVNIKYLKDYNVIPLLIVVVVNLIAELLAFFLNKSQANLGSAWIYNFSLPVELFSYGFLYLNIFKSKTARLITIIFLIGIPIVSFLPFLRSGSFLIFNTLLFTYGCIFLVFLMLTFFIKLFLADYFLINPLKLFYFWVSSGVLLCYLGGFMYLSNLNYLFKEYGFIYANLQNLNFILNCFLYSCFIISIECLKAYPNSQIRSL